MKPRNNETMSGYKTMTIQWPRSVAFINSMAQYIGQFGIIVSQSLNTYCLVTYVEGKPN
jgi:hypothetical protein